MHIYLIYAAFGWLAFSGTAHFIVDVVAQYLRGKRAPGMEATLYYGVHSAFALGQILFGLICLWIAWRQPGFLGDRLIVALCLAAAAGWFAITLAFMEYWEPKVAVAIFAALLIAAVITAPERTS